MDRSFSNFTTIKSMLKPRPFDAHKGTFGHGLLVAGNCGMAGAAILAAQACFRTGVGKLTIMTQEVNRMILQVKIPEAILCFDEPSFRFQYLDKQFNALAIGPGIGLSMNVVDLEENILNNYNRPMVIDADAINMISHHPELMSLIPPNSILTPHKAEFDRLTKSLKEKFNDIPDVLQLAEKYHVVFVMKGPFTQIVLPNNTIYVNTTGNVGMATAGSGDVLTGMILAFLSNGYLPSEAAVIAVYLHGLAGDLAAENMSQDSLMASDIINNICHAFRLLRC